MSKVLTREGLFLLGANLLILVLFLVVYKPVPPGYEAGVKMRGGHLVVELNSADPQLFAGRELHWHTGESPLARWFAWLNSPAAFCTSALSIAVAGWLVRLSGVSRSWVEAAFFLVFLIVQW